MAAEVQKIVPTVRESAEGEKHDKFVKLAQRRTVNAIRAIRTIGKLGNKAHYQYDERDVKKIVSALNKEVEALKIKMTTSGQRETIEFKL